jgi:hypothetical protein
MHKLSIKKDSYQENILENVFYSNTLCCMIWAEKALSKKTSGEAGSGQVGAKAGANNGSPLVDSGIRGV